MVSKGWAKGGAKNAAKNGQGSNQQGGLWLVACACLLYAVSAGLRGTYGIMLGGICQWTGIDYASISFVLATGQLTYGVSQPFFGALALRFGNSFVLSCGFLCMAIGLVMIPFCIQPALLFFFLGIILPIGTGAVCFGILMGAITPKLGEARAAAASGLVNACSGLGSVLFSPLIRSSFASHGVGTTLLTAGALVTLLLPLAVFVGGDRQQGKAARSLRPAARPSSLPIIKGAFCDRNYLRLTAGFFTCGFHMAIIETHLFSQLLSFGLADAKAALFFSGYGAATITGSIISGMLCARLRKEQVLACLYGSRTFIIAAFLLLPKGAPLLLATVLLLGLTGAATVPPTAGLITRLFGSPSLAALLGCSFLFHQVGAFISAWFGGIILQMTGSYSLIWNASALLSLLAAIVCFHIEDEKEERKVEAVCS